MRIPVQVLPPPVEELSPADATPLIGVEPVRVVELPELVLQTTVVSVIPQLRLEPAQRNSLQSTRGLQTMQRPLLRTQHLLRPAPACHTLAA